MFFHYFITFIFFHFLSFSFNLIVFVGCSKSDFFLGLNFVTISLDSSFVKNQFLGPSRGVPLWALFSFFPTLFSPVFLSFLLLFIFSFFLNFVFISSFLVFFFNVFHFLLSFF